MSIMECLSQGEKDMMADYIAENASYDRLNPEKRMPIEHILRIWARNKEYDLFNLFDGKLILNKKVVYERDFDEIYDDMNDALFSWRTCNPAANNFIKSFRELTAYQGAYEYDYQLESLLCLDSLVKNTYEGNSFEITLPNQKVLNIQTGCKTVKMLGKIAKALNLPDYEAFRQVHSLVLNQKKLAGNLCISIHPMDYMTMSDNDCGWSSCMSWTEGGDYRRGTVEMMNSPYVVVAYLTSDNEFDTHTGHHWNSKKWRQLFIVTPHMISGIKGYPYRNDFLEEEVATWLRELAIKNLGWEFYDTMDPWSFGHTIQTDHGPRCVITHTNCMYNDCGKEQHAYFSLITPERYEITYSGDSECMWCGYVGNDFEDTDRLICGSCDESVHCEYCSRTIYHGDDKVYIDGVVVCCDCANDLIEPCEICHEEHLNTNMVQVYMALDHDRVVRSSNYSLLICKDCLDEWEDKAPHFLKKYGELYKDKLLWFRTNYYFIPSEEYKKRNHINPDEIEEHVRFFDKGFKFF